jgi:hypothetical protein
MANRLLSNRIYTAKKDTKIAFLKASIAGTGVATMDPLSKGILSFARSAAGKYLVTFGVSVNGVNALDVYREFMGMTCNVIGISGTAAPLAPIVNVVNLNLAAGTLELWFEATVVGGAIELGNGETVYAQFFFGDSSAP